MLDYDLCKSPWGYLGRKPGSFSKAPVGYSQQVTIPQDPTPVEPEPEPNPPSPIPDPEPMARLRDTP